MSVFEKIRSWASPKSRRADAERDVRAYLLGALKVVSAYADVLEHEKSILMSEAHLPFGKEQIRHSIEFLQAALRSTASRMILVKLLPPERAQLILSSQYEQNLSAVLYCLDHFVPDAEARASEQDLSKSLMLDDSVAKNLAAKAAEPDTPSKAPNSTPNRNSADGKKFWENKDYARAAISFRKASEEGDAEAQYRLGKMYRDGEGVPQDYAESSKWGHKAADQGNVAALYDRGWREFLVTAIPVDYTQAHKWLTLAASLAINPEAQVYIMKHRDIVAAEMTPEQIADAQRRASEWMKAHYENMPPAQISTVKATAEKAHSDVSKAMSEPIPESPPLPPPTLNWAEREAGQPRQLPLPGLADVPTLAERAFIRLAQNWHEGFAVVGREQAPPRVVDELALAAVLLAREHGGSFTNVAWRQAEANIALAEKRPVSWIDRLPWRLAATARLMEPGEHWGIEDLDGTLNHHNSALRIWTMEVAWMVRPWLERDAALPLLLENVAGTLAGVEKAWGLAGALFDSVEHFYAAAESWQPGHFAKQYAERMALLKDRGLLATQASFWMTESACRCLIADRAMTPDDVGPTGPSAGTKATMSLSRIV